ncbi:MAG TPA: beta-propeller fold lactonase family protein [Mucilaginibacter sp.]|jgi:DNA-binding beta-propeller fold protein YncE|nr:beta-propeller fold lactonase family protein [Mucilaginibacter sp.]
MKNFLLLCFLFAFLGSASYAQRPPVKKVRIGVQSIGSPEVKLKLVARLQALIAEPGNKHDIYDKAIYSPKSVHILEKTVNGKSIKKLYVNSLEGGQTVVYDMNDSLKKIAVINHTFTNADSTLFKETNFPGYTFKPGRTDTNVFTGKPVEMCLSNNDKYLWVPYYRRDYDPLAQEPSAMAIIDVDSDKIVRVMPTAPLPKMVACSQDDKFIAVTNWGDNTVHLIDISSGDPNQFRYVAHFVVDYKLNLDNFGKKVDRDVACGLCLRGTVFTPDSNYLFVGRMGGGGIAIFDIKGKKYLGSVFGTKKNVRHLVIRGDYLYLSSNNDGVVEKTSWKDLLNSFLAKQGQKNIQYDKWQLTATGKGARTIDVTSDGAYLFASANEESKISIVRTSDMKTIGFVNADSYPVGMTMDKSNKYLVVTAQGRNNKGGNSVMIYEITRR